MTQEFNGIYWDTNDLFECKQALEMLYNRGINVETLLTLNFGSLWVENILEELGAL